VSTFGERLAAEAAKLKANEIREIVVPIKSQQDAVICRLLGGKIDKDYCIIKVKKLDGNRIEVVK